MKKNTIIAAQNQQGCRFSMCATMLDLISGSPNEINYDFA